MFISIGAVYSIGIIKETSPYLFIYFFLPKQLAKLQKYINKNLKLKHIRKINYFAKILVLFISKNGILRFCVDYQNLNSFIKKTGIFDF